MNAVTLLLIILPIVISLWVCRTQAKKKGLSTQYWVTMAVIFGPFAIPFVLLAKSKKTSDS
ncbi:MAG: hypothetical protein ISR69_03860 [Gammaproteobacteria bacterium]|nr:hypothetical protein [Gammaproteobacteria bacterium]